MSAFLAALALAIAALVAGLVLFARAYLSRLETERRVNRQMRRLQAWNERADAWERWANASGGRIPQSFLDEAAQITDMRETG